MNVDAFILCPGECANQALGGLGGLGGLGSRTTSAIGAGWPGLESVGALVGPEAVLGGLATFICWHRINPQRSGDPTCTFRGE